MAVVWQFQNWSSDTTKNMAADGQNQKECSQKMPKYSC